MIEKVLLYISAAPDLLEERAILGRAVAEIPTSLGWRILQSPVRGERVDLEAVAQADVHLMLLGSDIRAPIGVEWLSARRSGHKPELFLKQGVSRTRAASEFLNYMDDQGAVWHPFQGKQDLRLQALFFLSDHLLRNAVYYSISAKEQGQLNSWQEELSTKNATAFEDVRVATGESSLIISLERYIPTQGILLEPKKKP